MAITPNYSLSIYPSTDTTTKFLDFRVAIAGTQTTSNFYVIDTVLKTHADQITSLQNSPSAYAINATYSAANYYTATSTGYPGYLINQLISLSLNQNNVGTVTISINGGSTVSVMKYNYSGTLVNMESNDFIANNQILCIYDGIEFVAIGVKNANIVNIAGTIGDVVTISSNNTLVDSGVKIGAANGLATLDSSSNVIQNANTASKLKTAVNVGSASFDGSNSITATQMGVIPNVTTPTTGNFPVLTSTGTLQNSTYNPSSFPQGTITLESSDPTIVPVNVDTLGGYSLAQIILLLYPVGSIYMSTVSTSPATLFGGTWTQIKDKFLLSAGDTYSAGATGGEAAHALTASELADHFHRTYSGNRFVTYDNITGGAYGVALTSGSNAQIDWTTGAVSVSCGEAHNNMPPYLTVYVWQRTA